MSSLRISLIQSHTIWHNPQANRELFESLILGCQDKTDLFILPEVFTSGFTTEAAPFSEPMDGPSVSKMCSWAKSKDALVMGSLLIRENGFDFNRLVCAFPDGSTRHYDKRHLFSFSNEDKIVKAGTQRLIFKWRDWTICPLICYDLRFPAWSRNNEAFDLLVYLANWPASRAYAWKQLLKARAIENQCFLTAVNRTGTDGRGLAYAGDSVLLDFAGKALIDLGSENTVRTIEIYKEPMHQFRNKFPFLNDQDHFTIH